MFVQSADSEQEAAGRGDIKVAYKKGTTASRIHAGQSYVSSVKLLFHREPPQQAVVLAMAVASLATSSRVYILVGGGG